MNDGLVAAFRPDLRVRLEGSAFALRHFAAEYRRALVSAGIDDLAVAIAFVEDVGPAHGVVFRGRYKTVAWMVDVSADDERSIRARVAIRGRPRSFALSLVQGYYVEPLISLASAAGGTVLLPGSGICLDGDATLLLGRSRSGKSTLSAVALASDRPILGDDQILLDGSGTAYPFPRRLRFYSDLPLTSPEAYARLPSFDRAALKARRLTVVVTRGFVAPPIRVPAAAIGPEPEGGGASVSRVVVIERAGTTDELSISRPSVDEVVGLATAILDEQRSHLAGGAAGQWLARLDRTRERETEILSQALQGRQLERFLVPTSWDAPRAASELGRRLGIAR